MLLDLKPLFSGSKNSLDVEFSKDMSELEFLGFSPLKKPVKISGKIKSCAGIVEADINCEVEYTAPCDRCFKETVKKYSFNIDRTIVTHTDNEDNDEMTVVSDMMLDLDDFCYTEIVMSLPTKHLCKETCKGLCADCGKDLNSGDCGCRKAEIDPRLSALEELLKE